MSEVQAIRRKWDVRYQAMPLVLPPPHPLGVRWQHRFIGGAMLDAAAGLGRGIATAKDAFAPIFAVDLSPVGLSLSRRLWGERLPIHWIAADVNRVRWPKLGLVCAFGFTDFDFLRRVRELLAPGGMLLYEGFSTRLLEQRPNFNPDWLASPRRLEQLFAGFEILALEDDSAPPYRLRLAAVQPGGGS